MITFQIPTMVVGFLLGVIFMLIIAGIIGYKHKDK